VCGWVLTDNKYISLFWLNFLKAEIRNNPHNVYIAIFGSLFPRKNISHCWLNMNAKIEKNQFNEAMRLIYIYMVI